MNRIFFLFILSAYLLTAFMQFSASDETLNPMGDLGKAIISSAQDSVSIAINLVGVMTLFLGLMRIVQDGGLMRVIARLLKPIMIRLFPDVPAEHPAMGSMIMNLAANALGLGNAATPFGIKAMQELQELNKDKETATNAMILFLAINTSSVTLIPTSVIALRAQAGSADPAGILPTTLFATLCSTFAAILIAKTMAKFYKGDTPALQSIENINESQAEEIKGYPMWKSVLAMLTLVLSIPICIKYSDVISAWLIPSLIMMFVGYGFLTKVAVYESFTEGAKEGFQIAIKIIPYLVAMMVSIGMLRSSGVLDALVNGLGRFTEPLGLPGEALPMALIRPLSGSGAFGILTSTLSDPNIGPDSYVGYLVSTIMGCTETTFYVIAVYFGAVQVKRLRYAIPVALLADLVGIMASVVAVKWYFA